MKTIQKNRIIKISVLILLTILVGFGILQILFLPYSYPLKNINENFSEYESLYEHFSENSNIYLLMNYDKRDFAYNLLFRDKLRMMINGYYSKDWIFNTSFVKFDTSYASINWFESENKSSRKYNITEIMSGLDVDSSKLYNLVTMMHSLNVNVINRANGIVEFTNELFLTSSSLDYYTGYLYYSGPRTDIEKNKHYTDVVNIRPNWYGYKKRRTVFRNNE